ISLYRIEQWLASLNLHHYTDITRKALTATPNFDDCGQRNEKVVERPVRSGRGTNEKEGAASTSGVRFGRISHNPWNWHFVADA
ncbi:MAG: hypothetical protein J6V14_08075, partial [Clostridia bacterium]|nr:hypothetical protein [Clostridia bacterium]